MVGPHRGWWRPGLLAAVLVAVAVELGSVALSRSRDGEAEQAMQRQTDLLASCILGDAASGADDGQEGRVLLALRRAELASMGLSLAQRRATAELPWPSRCARHARALVDDETARGSLVRAKSTARLAATLDAEGSATGDWGGALVAWLADVRGAGRHIHQVDDVSRPPGSTAEPAMNVDSLDPEARLLPGTAPLASVHFGRTFDETAAFVLDDAAVAVGPRVPAYCVYADAEVHCRSMRGAAAAAGALVPGGASVVLAGEGGAGGVFEADTGARVPVDVPDGVYGVSAATEGRDGLDLVTTRPIFPEVRLFHVEGHGAAARVTETPFLARSQAGDPSYNVGLFWGFLVTKRTTPEAPGLRLRVRALRGALVGPEIDVGQVGEARALEATGAKPHLPHIEGCKSEGGHGRVRVLRVRGWDAEYFSFFKDGAWTHPVATDAPGGEMTCHGAEVALVDQRGHVEAHRYEAVVRQSRCTPDGCRTERLQTRDLFTGKADVAPEELRDVHVASVDDKVLLVWKGGDTAGLRMRLATLEQMANADDVVLFDDHVNGGHVRQDSTLLDFGLRPIPEGALVMLATSVGTYLYRVDAGGSVSPVRVRFD